MGFISDAERTSVSPVGSHKGWCQGEPLVTDMLADPIVGLLMRSDGVTLESFAALLTTVRANIATPTVASAANLQREAPIGDPSV